VVRGGRRLAWIALVLAIAGCTLITGVGDLDPSLPDGVDPNEDSSTPIPTADGPVSTGDSSTEAGPMDAGIDTAPGIKAITFENGQLVHPLTGGDLAVGDASLLTKDANVDESGDATTLTAIGGEFSMHVDSIAFIEESFTPIDEVYVVMRLRVDAPVTATVPILRVTPQTGTTTIDVRLDATQKLSVSQGAQIGVASKVLDVGTIYKVGLHVKKGKNFNGTVQVYLAADGTTFGAPFAQSMNIDFERSSKLQVGLSAANSSVTFDDVKIDGTQLWPY